MTRTNACLLLVLLVLLLGVVSTPLAAQDDTYTVQEGDNLWNLAGARLNDARLWEKIYSDNPFLRERGRRFQKQGIVYVMVRPGEKLFGLEKLGIIPTITPISQLQLAQPTPITVTREVPTTPIWVWWPLAVALIMLLVAWLIYRMLTKNPVTARPAMVHGGVTADTATENFQQMAGRAQMRATGQYVPSQQFTVLEQVAGRIWGVLNVRYADGREVPRRLSGDAAFQARVRFPNGTEETLYMLQGCGNDLRYGGISRYLPGPEFRFEANPVPQPVPTPAQPEPAPVAPPPAPVAVAVASEPPAPAPIPEMETKPDILQIVYRPEENGKDSMVQADGIDVERFTFTKNGSSITFRFREAKTTELTGV